MTQKPEEKKKQQSMVNEGVASEDIANQGWLQLGSVTNQGVVSWGCGQSGVTNRTWLLRGLPSLELTYRARPPLALFCRKMEWC